LSYPRDDETKMGRASFAIAGTARQRTLRDVLDDVAVINQVEDGLKKLGLRSSDEIREKSAELSEAVARAIGEHVDHPPRRDGLTVHRGKAVTLSYSLKNPKPILVDLIDSATIPA
jgi:hypothetical protein